MLRRLLLLPVLAFSLAAAVNVGVFPEEIKHVFTTAQGLPANDVNCVAAAGGVVYAGAANGLASYSNGAWHLNGEFSGGAVALCTASPDAVYFTYGSALYRFTENRPHRVASLPVGARAIAARGKLLFVGTDHALFEIDAAGTAFRAVRLPVPELAVRQIGIGPSGEVAVAAGEGLFVRDSAGAWTRQYPRHGERSWAPVDVRGVVYDSRGRLWFAAPQGAGYRDGSGWRLLTGLDGLPYDDFTTVAAGGDGVVWFGTRRGAIRYDGKVWEYRQGLAWLPDNDVRAIAIAENGSAWFATRKGAGL
ncbi:MAG: hypothetical protein ACRD9L_04665, partial [Bryobacteraceae bacterium]